jgi:DNA polymerase-1
VTTGLGFRAVWVLDFEFVAQHGEHPAIVCLVAHDLITDKWVNLWRGEFGDPPFSLGPECLFVAFSAAAEWSCFLTLGWPMPQRCIDLYPEFIRIHNGKFEGKLYPSLIAAASHFGIPVTAAADKETLRGLIMTGGPWSDAQRAEILDYCSADVRMTADLFQAMQGELFSGATNFGGALLRGRYTCAVARMERNGIPIDIDALNLIKTNWEAIKLDLIVDIDKDFGVYEGSSFVTKKFADYIERAGIPWPTHPSGALKLDEDTFRERSKAYPILAPLRELRHNLDGLRLTSFSIGSDGRNRTALMPFASKTGRNQPSNSRFIFGASRWLRSLIKPAQGRAIAYVDWSSQEVAIAAALSGDEILWQDYIAGDAYLNFAKQAGLVPATATKSSHEAERNRVKALFLGIGYGMSAESIAAHAGLHIDVARSLLLRHKLRYRQFWAWAEWVQNAGLLGQKIQTTFGWTWQAGYGTDVNPRSLLNWPMQANGAEMMRLACCELTERGIMVCCPVHDAILIEASIEEIDHAVQVTQGAMERASELVLGKGKKTRTDAQIVRFPDRYADKGGIVMWQKVMAQLEKLAFANQMSLIEPALVSCN